MVANVEAMFSVRETPWHGLGKVIEAAPTSAEAIRLAGLDWKVGRWDITASKVDGLAEEADVKTADAPEFRAIVRETDQRVLGIVSSKYEPVQNVQAFDFCDPLIQSGKLRYETAGSLGGGKRIWVLGRIGSAEVVPGDEVAQYLLLTFGHDGLSGVTIKPTGVRVVCQNTVNAALRDGVAAITLRHTASVHKGLADAGAMFANATEGFEQTVEAYRALARKQMNTEQLDAYVMALVPKDENVRDARRAALRESIKRGFESAPGNSLVGVRGTAWAAYNSVTYNATHEAGRDKGAEKRVDSLWFGAGAAFVKKAWDQALALV